MLRRRGPIIALLAFTIAIGLGIGARVVLWSDREPSSSVIGGPFALIDGDGHAVTNNDFAGRFMLIYFGYTYCPDVCPTSLGIMAAAIDKLSEEDRKKVVPIFITVDPGRDTPKVVKDYAASFHPQMVGLTGSEEQVAAVEKAYKVYAARAKGDDPSFYTVDHSSIVYLMGPDGRLLAHFVHSTTVDEMVKTIAKHLGG